MTVLGACHGADDTIFYPAGAGNGRGSRPPDYSAAARICASCKLREPCLQAALDTDARWGAHGFWAGMSPEQRAGMSPEQRADLRRRK